jgi:hypothetical protein
MKLYIPTYSFWLVASLLALPTQASMQNEVTRVPRIQVQGTNHYYVSNRLPLEASRLVALPIGSIQPKGWLLEMLNRERNGLAGHLGEISVWLQKTDNAWLSKDGQGQYGWEEVPYWLRGYIQMAYIFNDTHMILESHTWIEGVLNSQRPDGDFGPNIKFQNDGSRDFWANMLMMFALETYYEHTNDKRVITVLENYFKYQLTVPDEKFLTHYWQKMRGGDNLYSVYWLYNRTGNPALLELATKIHRCTANWEMKGTLPNWHNVNIAESFREPAMHYMQTHNVAELEATYADFNEVRKRYGQVPGGMFGSDENCRVGYSDPRQAVETCGMVEQMFSDEILMEITGDPKWIDNCEDVAFNTLPAAFMEDMKALRYLTAPNMVISDSKNHAPGIGNKGPFLTMNPFSSRCCQHNHSMGWPYFSKYLWYATSDDGLCTGAYSESEVTAKVGDGTTVRVEETTHYPFVDKINFTVHTLEPVVFPLYLRVPGWCKAASVSVNGVTFSVDANPDSFICIRRLWNEKDLVVMTLPMQISTRTWTENKNSVTVDYGPLSFSLNIGENYKQVDTKGTIIHDSRYQKGANPLLWPSHDIFPLTSWNYALELNNSELAFTPQIEQGAWPKDNYPFSALTSPLRMITRGKQVAEWSVDKYELCGVLPQSPVKTQASEESLVLIPMGAARLRISAFPTTTK